MNGVMNLQNYLKSAKYNIFQFVIYCSMITVRKEMSHKCISLYKKGKFLRFE